MADNTTTETRTPVADRRDPTTATLTITDNRTGKIYEIAVHDGAIRAMDLRQIKVSPDDFGMMTYDPAFLNTAACRSGITYIDGDKGILLYRGYPIEQLAENSNFLETAYLILFGELPTSSQMESWRREITLHTMLHENIKKFMEGFASDGHLPEHRGGLVDLLSRRQEHFRRTVTPEADAPAYRQGAEHRGLRVPTQHRAALHLSGQRSELHR
jgi:citrate synthase